MDSVLSIDMQTASKAELKEAMDTLANAISSTNIDTSNFHLPHTSLRILQQLRAEAMRFYAEAVLLIEAAPVDEARDLQFKLEQQKQIIQIYDSLLAYHNQKPQSKELSHENS